MNATSSKMHPEDPALTSPCTPSSPGLAAQEGTRVPHPTSDACSHTHSARKTTGEAEVLNGRKTAGEMKTNSLSSFVPTVHSKKKKKEQAALLKEKKKISNNTKSYYKLPSGLDCCSPAPVPSSGLQVPGDEGLLGAKGSSHQGRKCPHRGRISQSSDTPMGLASPTSQGS